MTNVEYEIICFGENAEPKYGLYRMDRMERKLISTSNDENYLINLPSYNGGNTVINLINCKIKGKGTTIIYK